jgi:hypothetical protein
LIRDWDLVIRLVPGEGLEPTRVLSRRILSPLRLPIPPPRHFEPFGGDERIRTAE